MRQVTLEAKTHKGKNQLNELTRLSIKWDGNFDVLEERESVVFSNERGPWLYIAPAKEEPRMKELWGRWVNERNDKNFIVRSNVKLRGCALLRSPA